MAELLDLPEAALAQITTFLDVKGLLSLSQTCKRARHFADSNDLLLWGARCGEVGVENLKRWKCRTYRQLYTRLLHQYRPFLGVWTSKAAPWGSVLVVHMQAPAIVGSCLATKKMNEAVQLRPVFEIVLKDDGQPQLNCLRLRTARLNANDANCDEHLHTAELDLHEDRSSFVLSCGKNCKQDEYELDLRKTRTMPPGTYQFQQQATGMNPEAPETPEIVDSHPEDEAEMVLQMLNHAMTELYRRDTDPATPTFTKLELPLHQAHPLEGLWKGTYGTHGIEVVLVRVEGEYLVGTKLTGDYNVPAGEVTFRAPLSSKEKSALKFILPAGVTPRVNAQQLANSNYTTQATYDAEGQVARPGFHSPSFIPAKLYHFTDDCFGILWHSIHTFSLFKRVLLVPALKREIIRGRPHSGLEWDFDASVSLGH